MKLPPVLLKTEWTDPVTGAKGYFVIDRLIGGYCGGGIRMRPGLDSQEVERLARTMTYKLVGLGIPSGGAKGGIAFDPATPGSREVLKRFLEAHRPFLLECWATSEDLGTREDEIMRILFEIGVNTSVHCMLAKSENPQALGQHLIRSLSLVVDGLGITDVVTGFGVAEVTAEALAQAGKSTEGSTVAVQGFGSAGGSAARYLQRLGMRIMAVADAQGTIYRPAGLDVELLLQNRNRRGEVDRSALPGDYQELPRDAWLGLNVDVLVPAAIADAINEGNMHQVKAGLIVEAANIPTTAGAERELRLRGVTVVPDFIANAGGAGLFGVVLFQQTEGDAGQILGHLAKQLRAMTARMIARARADGITPREAAARIVEDQTRELTA